MNEYLIGALCGAALMWLVLGVYGLLGNTLHWEDYDAFWIVLCLPLLLLIAPPMCLWQSLFYGPWRNVIHPARRDQWEQLKWGEDGSKAVRLFGQLYFCFEPKASKWYNRVFFVRVKG